MHQLSHVEEAPQAVLQAAGAGAEGAAAVVPTIDDLPAPLITEICRSLTVPELAVCGCVSKGWLHHAQEALHTLEAVDADHFPSLRTLHNLLLLGDGGCRALRPRLLRYLPAAFLFLGRHCRSLRRLHLHLPPPPIPISVAAGRAAVGAAFGPLGPFQQRQEFPPVDGFLTKLVAQGCPNLTSLHALNLTNNPAISRLVHVNDDFLAVLAKSCPQLEDLQVGHQGGEDSIYHLESAFYCEGVTDVGIKALARGCTRLRALGLLRCRLVTDEGLCMLSHYCRQLESLRLHDCPGVSDMSLVEVAETCARLRSLDVIVARRVSGLLLGGEEQEQLGFRALFTLAANCPLLEELVICEASLDVAAVDDDSMICIATGCKRLRRLVLRYCSGVSDTGICAVANRCKELQELTLEHTPGVADSGLLAVVRGCPRLRRLHLVAHMAASLARLPPAPEGSWAAHCITDATLRHVADHCTALEDLAITGARLLTDAGVRYLALPKHAALHQRLRHLAINHTSATEGSLCELLARCGALRSLGVRGLLFNADSTMACIAASCRQLTALDLRHCSTMSDAGLTALARLPLMEDLAASFCVQLTDAGVRALAEAAGGRLRRLELYHVPHLTAAGVRALAQRCTALQRLNLGKCAAIRELAGGRGSGGALVLACHYVDAA